MGGRDERPRYALSALKGFTGIVKGAAIEHTFDRHFGALMAGELPIPRADITGWKDTPMGVLTASRQADQGFQLELARRTRRALGERFTVIDAADHRSCAAPPSMTSSSTAAAGRR